MHAQGPEGIGIDGYRSCRYNPCPLLPSRSLVPCPSPVEAVGRYPIQTPGFLARGPSLAAGVEAPRGGNGGLQRPVPAVSHGPRKLRGASSAVECGSRRCGRQARAAGRGAGAAGARLDQLLDMPARGWRCSLRHAWNPEDRSLNVFVKDDDRLTFHGTRWRRARMASAARWAARGVACTPGRSTGLRGGARTRWWAPPQPGPLPSVGYAALVGSGRKSWGWDLGRSRLYHDGKNRPGVAYPAFLGPERPLRCPTHCSWCWTWMRAHSAS